MVNLMHPGWSTHQHLAHLGLNHNFWHLKRTHSLQSFLRRNLAAINRHLYIGETRSSWQLDWWETSQVVSKACPTSLLRSIKHREMAWSNPRTRFQISVLISLLAGWDVISRRRCAGRTRQRFWLRWLKEIVVISLISSWETLCWILRIDWRRGLRSCLRQWLTGRLAIWRRYSILCRGALGHFRMILRRWRRR